MLRSKSERFVSSRGWSVDQSSGKVNVNFFGSITLATGGHLNLNGNEIINVSKILGMDGKWSMDETGKLIVKEIETEKICVGKYCLTEKEVEALLQQAGLLNTQNTMIATATSMSP